jgi:hypothetical protein
MRSMLRIALALALVGLCACSHKGSARLEGRWKGTRADGVAPELQSAANAFATQTEIDVRGDAISVTTPKEKQTGTYKVVKEDKGAVTIVTDKDGPNDAQVFTFVDDKTMRWTVLEGKTITFARQ